MALNSVIRRASRTEDTHGADPIEVLRGSGFAGPLQGPIGGVSADTNSPVDCSCLANGRATGPAWAAKQRTK